MAMDKIIASSSSPPSGGDTLPTSSSNRAGKMIKKPICWCFIVMAILLLLGIGAFTFLFVLHKTPKATNKNASFRVDSISVSPFKLSNSSQITASWDVQFSVQNPSTTSVLYQTLITWIRYKQERLTNATIAPFHIQGSNWTTMDGKLTAKSVKVDEKVIKDIAEEMGINGSANFNIGLYAGYWISGNDETNMAWWAVEAYCNGVKVGFSPEIKEHKLIGGPIQCILTKTW